MQDRNESPSQMAQELFAVLKFGVYSKRVQGLNMLTAPDDTAQACPGCQQVCSDGIRRAYISALATDFVNFISVITNGKMMRGFKPWNLKPSVLEDCLPAVIEHNKTIVDKFGAEAFRLFGVIFLEYVNPVMAFDPVSFYAKVNGFTVHQALMDQYPAPEDFVASIPDDKKKFLEDVSGYDTEIRMPIIINAIAKSQNVQ